MSFQQHFQENPATITHITSLACRNEKQNFLVQTLSSYISVPKLLLNNFFLEKARVW